MLEFQDKDLEEFCILGLLCFGFYSLRFVGRAAWLVCIKAIV